MVTKSAEAGSGVADRVLGTSFAVVALTLAASAPALAFAPHLPGVFPLMVVLVAMSAVGVLFVVESARLLSGLSLVDRRALTATADVVGHLRPIPVDPSESSGGRLGLSP